MPIEPASIQRDKMLSFGKTHLILAQFLVVKDPAVLGDYLSLSKKITVEQGGRNLFQGKINQVLAGGELPYQVLTVDSFPSSLALLVAHENLRAARQAALAELYALIIKPTAWIPPLVKGLRITAPTLSRWLDTSSEKVLDGFAEQANPDIEPVPETIHRLKEQVPQDAFYMMNLNKHYSRKRGQKQNRWRLWGKAAYDRYSARILPYLVSVGGYPALIGPVVSCYIGDEKSKLYDSWSDFGLVYYPSPSHFLRLMTNTPGKAVEYRRAGLQRAVLMPCSKTQIP